MPEIRNCPHGRGAFATRRYAPGEIIEIITGGKLTAKPEDWSHSLEMVEGVWWEAFAPDQEGYWSNFLDHADEPNCDLIDFDQTGPSVRVVARRLIEAGEELYINYDWFPLERRLPTLNGFQGSNIPTSS